MCLKVTENLISEVGRQFGWLNFDAVLLLLPIPLMSAAFVS